ncbi:MAG: NAD(P)-binding domain-containing protein, partial [Actinomycetota bacterium]
MSAPLPAKVHVIGAGLVGTSIALKLKALGVSVSVEDSSLQNQALARDLIQSSEVVTPPRVVFVAVSPVATAETCASALSRFSDSIVV